jgi:hypothetical protein
VPRVPEEDHRVETEFRGIERRKVRSHPTADNRYGLFKMSDNVRCH